MHRCPMSSSLPASHTSVISHISFPKIIPKYFKHKKFIRLVIYLATNIAYFSAFRTEYFWAIEEYCK